MNNYNNISTCDALSSSEAIMGSGHDMGMHRRYGDEELGDQVYLQQNFTTVQEQSNTLPSKTQWRSENNNSNDIKRTDLINHNGDRRAMFYLFNELLSEEDGEEENEGKKEEKIEGKKEEKNEKKKGKKEKKKKKRGRGSRGTRNNFISALGTVSELDDNSNTSQQTSDNGKRVLDDKSQRNNRGLLRDISHSSEKISLGYDSKELGFVSLPTRSEWNDKPKTGELGLRELCGDESLDPFSQIETQYSDQNDHNQYPNERKDSTLSELCKLPGHICEHLDKNNRFGFHQITSKESFDFVESEYIEYFNETYGITGVRPVFIDHSGFVIWFLDKDDNMYEWDEMQRNLRYMGKDLIDGLTNNFIYPENICEIMEDTGERIPVEEFKRQMEEKAKSILDDCIILKNIFNHNSTKKKQ